VKTFILIGCLFSCLNLYSAEQTTFLLKEHRDRLVFNELSAIDKKTILDQSNIIFSKIYVNLEAKRRLYQFNPEAKLSELSKRVDEISTSEFHSEMAKLYNSAKDYHVNYYFPKPYGCHTVKIPISISANMNNQYLITGIDLDSKNLIPEIENIELGSEVLSYNGKKIKQVISEKMELMNASTKASRKVFAEYDLIWKDIATELAPQQNEVKFVIRKADGSIQKIVLPWLLEADLDCLKNDSSDEGVGFEKRRFEYVLKKEKWFENIWTKFRNRLLTINPFKNKFFDLSNAQKELEENVLWKVLNFKDKKIAYLKIKSFRTTDSYEDAKDIQAIFEKNLSGLDAIIVDVRSNYGGQIDFSEYVASLFYSEKPKQVPFKIRANESTRELFDSNESWYKIIDTNLNSKELVGPDFISAKGLLKRFPYIHYPKIALLTNAECFSSCEIFAAAMKDFAHAKIYGTNDTTFGGGANVWDHDYFSPAFLLNGVSESVPGQVKIRATVRNGHRPSDQSIIDDVGIKSDKIIPLENAEMINRKHSRVIYKIAEDLFK
jgi:hypothetical protein